MRSFQLGWESGGQSGNGLPVKIGNRVKLTEKNDIDQIHERDCVT